jgi:Icc-related predicted phosphoesterase
MAVGQDSRGALSLIVDCIADLHGNYPKLDGGDLLIVAGDLTGADTDYEYWQFNKWIKDQNPKYGEVIVIAGNHDNLLIQTPDRHMAHAYCHPATYLCDSGTEFEYYDERFPEEDEGFLPSGKRTLKIWGSPWTKTFKGMNPHCMAFTKDTEEELNEKWDLIPTDTDILITHSPPYGILDMVPFHYRLMMGGGNHKGSKSLALKVGKMEPPPKLWVWGHIHEAYGVDLPIRSKPCKMVNASHVNYRYQPVNKPIRIEL